MPTNQTPNYKLNQWVRSDRILMEDFNADNAKIDAALQANAAAVAAEGTARTSALSALEARSTAQLIRSATVSANTQSYTLSLSGISWSLWREIRIVAEVYPTGGTTPLYQVFAEGASSTSAIGGSKYPMVLLLYPAGFSSFPFAGIALGTNPQPFNRETAFSKITDLRFQGSGSAMISAGSKITVYGLK